MAHYDDLGEALAAPDDVTSLELVGDGLHVEPLCLGSECSAFVRLERLEIANASPVRFAPGLRLPRLKTLLLGDVRFEAWPEAISSFDALERLEMAAPRRNATLPGSVERLQNLRRLKLYGFAALCPELASLRRLVELDLSWNRLTDLGPVWRMPWLERLDLSANPLPAIPPQIANLQRLQRLVCDGDARAGRRGPGRELGARAGVVGEIPAALCTLPALRELSLCQQRVRRVAPRVAELTALRCLRLAGNALASVPPELFALSGLVELDLGHNRLASLPEDLARLRSLEVLALHGNPLARLPDALAALPALRRLKLWERRLPASERERLRRLLPEGVVGTDEGGGGRTEG
ncbi:MAG: hypothetical protein D6731_04280 [Planctomycetota bacterium]|nr:MAG: hypothetical protein D6731_04280 [Planctomycetota bacterium]